MSTVREVVSELLKSKVLKSFYPTLVSKKTNLSLVEVESELDALVQEGIIAKEYELNCGGCFRTLDSNQEIKALNHEEFCPYCGEELEEHVYTNARYIRP